MRVLSITTGEELVEPTPGGEPNRAQARQLALAAHLDGYHIITRTLGPRRHEVRHLTGRCAVYPSNSADRWSFLRDAERIASDVISREQIDLISVRDPFLIGRLGVRLKRRFRLPLVVHIMADMIDNPEFLRERWHHRYLNVLAHRVLPHADAVRVSTQRELDRLTALSTRRRRSAPVHCVPFFIDTEPFLDADGTLIRRNLGCADTDVVILAVGRLVPQKDFSTLIAAFGRATSFGAPATLVFVGGGPLSTPLRAQAERVSRSAGRPIHFAGPQPYKTVAAHYAAADIVAVTSRYEGTCMVLLEAGASAKPVVTTHHAGAPDAVVDGETGFIVPVGDPDAVAERLGRLIADETLRRTMGDRARQRIQTHFATADLVSACIRIWQNTLERVAR